LASFTFNTPGQTGSYPFDVDPYTAVLGPAYKSNILTGIENGTVFITLSGHLLPGDSNGDGVVDVSDAITLIAYILETNPQPFCIINADVNRDGNYDLTDVIGIINIMLGDGFYCGLSTMSDIDGNIYNTVLIGNQCWMKENLKTTSYRDGTPIEYPGNDNLAWQDNNTGAYSWYNNDPGWKISYGALYNWHAVNNTNSLCPEGWHVPSDADWLQLLLYVVSQGYPNQWDNPNGSANALKSCRQISSPLGFPCNTLIHPCWNLHAIHHGFDAFGFSGLPGGRRNSNGTFNYLNVHSYWWSTLEYSMPYAAWCRSYAHNSGRIYRVNHNKNKGFSVRCLKE